MSLNEELNQLAKKYIKKSRPTTLKQACLMSIQKWEEAINIILKHKEDYDSEDVDHLTCNSCGLCKFYGVEKTYDDLCKRCLLRSCKEGSIYDSTVESEYIEDFIYNAYKLIKKIRKRYKRITGEVLLSAN